MNKNVEVEVLIDSFKDNSIFNTPTKIKRNGKEIIIVQKLLQKGDKYFVTKENSLALSKKGIVSIIKNTIIKEDNKPE